jgi:type IV pilus assembly protein PilX
MTAARIAHAAHKANQAHRTNTAHRANKAQMQRVPHLARQGGTALVTAMVLMLAVLVIGFSSVRAALADAQSARHERDRQTALRAAEAALLDAERELAATPATAPRFAALAGAGFIDGCGKGGTDSHGLCAPASPPSWQAIDLASDDPALVLYGTFSMRDLGGVAQPPRYLVELMPFNAAHGRYYRITALGFGQRASTRVVLQSLYRMPPSAGPEPPGAPTVPVPATAPPTVPPGTEAPAAGEPRAEPPAAGETGTGKPDAGDAGAGKPAAGDPGAAIPAAGETGAGKPGTGTPDPGAPDAGAPDPGAPDAGTPAAGPVPVAPPALPVGRIGWREVANWPALHRATK